MTEPRIENLLATMTLEEKVALCHAGSMFAVNGNARHGIPELWMSDGPHGVRRELRRDCWDPLETNTDYATYLPTGTALAATWNVTLARLFGEVLGAEARDRRKDIILGPGINIVRTPLCGRNFEYYGEDPFQVAEMVVPVIEGIQSQSVAACVKHYAANSQELNRTGVDAQMDERTLREIYLPAFEAAVKRAGVLCVMGAYNKFRGQYCCHHEYLVEGILKREWGFIGSFISDWAGAHDTIEAAKFGLDIEMGTRGPFDEYYLARPFREAIEQGRIDLSLLDGKVRRNLLVMFRLGLFDPDRKPGERNTPRHQQAALKIAREAIVLLKNDHAVLPLPRSALRRVVVIGDNAAEKHALGGNSSAVRALYEVTPLEGLKAKLGDRVEMLYFRGYPSQCKGIERIGSEFLGTADEGAGTQGWKGFYFEDREGAWSNARKVGERADPHVDFDWTGSAPPFPGLEPEKFSVRWEARLTAPQNGTYIFVLDGASHAGLSIDGLELIQRWENGGPEIVNKSIPLQAGRTYQLIVRLKPGHPNVRVTVGWIPPWIQPAAENRDELLRCVSEADAVLFFGGQNHQYDVEGSDRVDMALHEGQNELLDQILGLNRNTAVVLVGGGPVEMPWLERAPAVVQMWYAGMEGGNAIAEVLLGDVAPSGKLPMTFPKRLHDSPAHALGDYAANVCRYKEGIFVGYRWFDSRKIEPLFPFGHGLSYTSFALEKLRLEKEQAGVRVTVQVTNTGGRAGSEVVQIYVGQPECSVERPLRELKGFAKVELRPGETKQVEVLLNRRAFSFWDTGIDGWMMEPGEYVIEAGVSSRDVRCKETIALEQLRDL